MEDVVVIIFWYTVIKNLNGSFIWWFRNIENKHDRSYSPSICIFTIQSWALGKGYLWPLAHFIICYHLSTNFGENWSFSGWGWALSILWLNISLLQTFLCLNMIFSKWNQLQATLRTFAINACRNTNLFHTRMILNIQILSQYFLSSLRFYGWTESHHPSIPFFNI